MTLNDESQSSSASDAKKKRRRRRTRSLVDSSPPPKKNGKQEKKEDQAARKDGFRQRFVQAEEGREEPLRWIALPYTRTACIMKMHIGQVQAISADAAQLKEKIGDLAEGTFRVRELKLCGKRFHTRSSACMQEGKHMSPHRGSLNCCEFARHGYGNGRVPRV